MVELIRTNDIVLIGFVQSLLEQAQIPVLVADGHVSAIEGSIGAFPRVVLSEGEYRAIAKNEGKVYERGFNVVNGVDGEVEVVAR